ncbi:hypothetical protein C8R47DRAFT_1118110 [Mycena vitilis]|nr:hypothetical protein C8R47DRAFT_1118110 [Mycena vitilis]
MDTLTIDLLDALPTLDSDTQETKAKATPVPIGILSVTTEKTATWEKGLPVDGAASFDYLFNRLVTEKEPLFLLGESPGRSLSISLAVMRGSLKNIWATSRYQEGDFWTSATFHEHIRESEERGKINSRIRAQDGLSHEKTSKDFDKFLEHCTHSLNKMDLLPNFSLNADACQLQTFIDDSRIPHLPHKHIFFQCPWDGWNDTGSLMRKTVQSAAEIQGPGDLLLFGLIDTRPESYPNCGDFRRNMYSHYKSAYEVPRLHSVAISLGYKSLKEDKDLIRRCLHFGYRHYSETRVDIHYKMVLNDELIVHPFIKLSPPKQT